MPAPFDPYHKWLGIPPKDQPPHHYRLLGIELFEDDVEVVDSAANRLMAYLHEVATDDATGLSQKLLNEISAARICLLNNQRKRDYDAQLKTNLQQQPPERDARYTPSSQPPIRSTSQPGGGIVSAKNPAQRLWLVGLAVAIGLGAVGVLAVVTGRVPWGTVDGDVAHQKAGGSSKGSAATSRNQRQAAIILDWPATQRAEATLKINGAAREIPSSTGIVLPLAAGPLELRITRPGYVDILWTCVVARGERVRYSPVWEPKETIAAATQPVAEPPPAQPDMTDNGASNSTTGKSDTTGDSESKTTTLPDKDAPDEVAIELPSHLAVPPLHADGGTEWTELLHVPTQVPIELRLLGGETLIGPNAFHMTPRHTEGDRQEWAVQLVDGQGQRTEVAELVNTAGTVNFRWRPVSDLRLANQLRNAVLEISVGAQKGRLPLRPAVVVPPLTISGDKGAGQIQVRIETLPDISSLRLELTRSTGVASFARIFEHPLTGPEQPITVDVGAGELNFPLEVQVTFQAPRAGARVVHIHYQLAYRSNNPQRASWSRRNITRNLAWAKTDLQQRTSVANQVQRDQLQRNIDYYTQLEELARGETQLHLQYRLLLINEAHQVVLATSEPAMAAGNAAGRLPEAAGPPTK